MRRGVAGNAGLYGLWRLVHLKRKIFGKDIRKVVDEQVVRFTDIFDFDKSALLFYHKALIWLRFMI